ncbi:hypothetical protein ACFPRL_03720 [Pseudoclavibacter helvolus]
MTLSMSSAVVGTISAMRRVSCSRDAAPCRSNESMTRTSWGRRLEKASIEAYVKKSMPAWLIGLGCRSILLTKFS